MNNTKSGAKFFRYRKNVKIYKTMTYKTLVLPGNGIKGVYTLGALESLGDRGKLNEIENFISVSSGAIISALLLMGMRPIDILARVLSKNLFQKVGRISMTGIINGASIFNFDPIQHEIESIFVDCIGKIPTFMEFYQQTDKVFVCLGYDATNHKIIYFSKDTYPDISVVKAIRASCAFPLLFDPVLIDDAIIVDGGVGDNYPLSWTVNNFPSPILSIHVKTTLKPITKETSRLTSLKELFSFVVRRPDLLELERNKNSVTVVKLQIGNASFFDFSNSDRVYLDQFDTGYNSCKNKLIYSC